MRCRRDPRPHRSTAGARKPVAREVRAAPRGWSRTLIPMIQPRVPSPEPARPAKPPHAECHADDQEQDFEYGDHAATSPPRGTTVRAYRVDFDATGTHSHAAVRSPSHADVRTLRTPALSDVTPPSRAHALRRGDGGPPSCCPRGPTPRRARPPTRPWRPAAASVTTRQERCRRRQPA